jgi:hypothetical protein
MIYADAISGLLLAVVGIYAALTSYTFGLGTLSQPEAGFFPFWASVLMVGCASAIALRSFARRPKSRAADAEQRARSTSWSKVSICVLALLGYAFALPWIGFGLSTFLVMLALSRLHPDTTWRASAVVAALGAFGFWLVFVRFLAVSFPPSLIAL